MVDGFFVKRVQDVRESAAYLTVMTRQLQKLYQVRRACDWSEREGGRDYRPLSYVLNPQTPPLENITYPLRRTGACYAPLFFHCPKAAP